MLYENLNFFEKEPFYKELLETVQSKESFLPNFRQKDVTSFLEDFKSLCIPATSYLDCSEDIIRIGDATVINKKDLDKLYDFARKLKPWRKGPFKLFDIFIDSEWNSSIKWNRLKDHIPTLTNKKIMDIGSSSGYYMFKMLNSNPQFVLGVEPFLRYYFQYKVLKHYINKDNIANLPLRFDDLPMMENYFDVIFCMGILYHRKSPLQTLNDLYLKLSDTGELILETLIIKGDDDYILYPEKTYAKMHNVYFIPTVKILLSWLTKAGFTKNKVIDISTTTINEQRKTDWIDSESLNTFLDESDNAKTVEGYPAPLRVIIKSSKSG